MCFDGHGIGHARPGRVNRDKVAGDAKVGRLNLLSFYSEEVVDIRGLRPKRRGQRDDQK